MNDTNKVVMTREEQKKVMLNILVKFADFCEQHDLEYFIDAGTLLGAIRHQGYIPWDDDIDVNMPRKDYNQFSELVRKSDNFMGEHLRVEFPEDTIYPFIKIADNRTILIEFPEKNPMECGVYIDVFPKDGIADLSWKSKLVCKTSEILKLMKWFNKFTVDVWRKDSNTTKKLIGRIGKCIIRRPNIPLKMQTALISNYNKKHPIEKCKYVTTLVNGEFINCAPTVCFSEYVLLDFEGRKFRGPVGYDEYLHSLYPGDYMQLPPKDQRRTHKTIIYWKSLEDKEDCEETRKI